MKLIKKEEIQYPEDPVEITFEQWYNLTVHENKNGKLEIIDFNFRDEEKDRTGAGAYDYNDGELIFTRLYSKGNKYYTSSKLLKEHGLD